MSERAEACRIAKELAEYYGGKPADFMSQAWDEVRSRREEHEEYDYVEEVKFGDTFLGRVAKKVYQGAKGTAKNQKDNWNMFKAPRDNPSDLIAPFNKLVTKRPEKIEIPPQVAEVVKREAKRMLKFW